MLLLIPPQARGRVQSKAAVLVCDWLQLLAGPTHPALTPGWEAVLLNAAPAGSRLGLCSNLMTSS